ncbi:hypothetical protein PVL29_000660 [Vitis rotundifolia]|uniref:Uncharacterized protein n=1 Tax=Vitis rotundifolia TaxID=103349 RepID=A0AA39AJI5_VITRO|nr:hypothetical protein PVL29_000660 [Vitis rotundifolia]
MNSVNRKGGSGISSIPAASRMMGFLHLKHAAMPFGMVDVIFSGVAVVESKGMMASIDRKKINDASDKPSEWSSPSTSKGKELWRVRSWVLMARNSVLEFMLASLHNLDCNAALSRQRKKWQIPTSLAPIGAVEGTRRIADVPRDLILVESTQLQGETEIEVNDVFWERFFTENLGSSAKEIQPERKDDESM